MATEGGRGLIIQDHLNFLKDTRPQRQNGCFTNHFVKCLAKGVNLVTKKPFLGETAFQ